MEKTKGKILLTHDTSTCGIMNQIRESEVRDWNVVTQEDLKSIERILENKSSRKGFGFAFDNTMMKIKFDGYAGRFVFPKESRGSNYTKPKKKKKEKMNLADLYMKHFPGSSAADLHFFMVNWGLGVYIPDPEPSIRMMEQKMIKERRKEAEDWIYKNSKILNKNNMENFSESDKEFLDFTNAERKNLESAEPCMSELNGTRIDFPKSDSPSVADGVKSGLGKVYDEAEGLTQEAFEAAKPKNTGQIFSDKPTIFGTADQPTGKILADPTYGQKEPGIHVQFKLVEGPELHVIFTDNDKKRIQRLVFPKEATMNDLFIAAEKFENGINLMNVFEKTTAQDVNHFFSEQKQPKEILEEYYKTPLMIDREKPDLYELAYESYHMLLELTKKFGNPINITQPSDEMKSKIQDYLEANEAVMKESNSFVLHGTDVKEKVDDSIKSLQEKTEWEEMVKNSSLEDLQKGIEELNDNIKEVARLNSNFPSELISDGYHTFKELYEFRLLYNAALFNEWAKDYMQQYNAYKGIDENKLHPEIKLMLKNLHAKYNVHKSWNHHDGEPCFDGGWFIVSAMLPTGLISNHYKAEYWDYFKVPEVDKALFEFDGHTSEDVQKRLTSFILGDEKKESMQCEFDMGYAGRCKGNSSLYSKYCKTHDDMTCVSCGKQATHQCTETLQLVCGSPLCDNCKHSPVNYGPNHIPIKK